MRTRILAVFVAMGLISQAGNSQTGAVVADWATPGAASPAARSTAAPTAPLPFIGVAPCRIVDTRGASGPFGGPALAPGVSRDFALPSGPCTGLPASAKAYSLNVTATNTAGPGFLKMYPQGGPAPVVSTLNYVAGETVANAVVIAAG